MFRGALQNAGEPRAPFLDQLHPAEYLRDRPISNLRPTVDSFFQRQPAVKHSRRGDFQPVVVNCHLNVRIIHIIPMTDGVGNHLTYRADRKLITLFSYQSVDLHALINVSKHELIRSLYLFI